MRVTSKPSSSGPAASVGSAKPLAASPVNAPSSPFGAEAREDALSVSGTAQFIAAAEAHLAAVPDVRMDKVDAVKAMLESDQYHPDGLEVAKGLVKEFTSPS